MAEPIGCESFEAVSVFEGDWVTHLEGWGVVHFAQLAMYCIGYFGMTVPGVTAPQP
ncbi:hypothetical protein D3C80_1972460 [compost metagenome]